MKKIIITILIATAFISLLLSANVKQNERKQQPIPIITTTPPPMITVTTTPKNGTIKGDMDTRLRLDRV